MCWLYVPGLVDSNLELDSQIRQQDVFVMSRGKVIQPRFLLNTWKKKPWMKLLSGLMLKRSTANLGVERWIASLEDILVSHSRCQVNVSEKKTRDICGPTLSQLSTQSDHQDVSLKTSQVIYRWDLKSSQMTCKAWAIKLRRECSQRRKWVHPTKETGFLSWPTAQAHDSVRGKTIAQVMRMKDRGKNYKNLNEYAEIWFSKYGRQDLTMPSNGKVCRPNLNPRFTEWLMGYPIGWIQFEPVVMELSHWWQRMRGEFSKAVCRYNQYNQS